MADDPYAILGVEPTTDIAQVRKAYLAQLRHSHPDLRPDDVEAERRTRELNRAWEQVRTRRTSVPPPAAPPDRRRGGQTAYSDDQDHFRLAFTSATLRVALIVVALGLVLLLAPVR